MGYVEGLLGKNEKIVVRTRRHWMVLVSSAVSNLVLSVVILAAAVGAQILGLPLPVSLLIALLLVLPIVFFLREFLEWWNEEYLVTNRRVVQAEGFINKHVIDSSLEKVNDVVLTQTFLGRVFDYGDVEILTASEIGVNKLDKIARPVKFKTEMINQKEALGSDEHFGRGPTVGSGDIPTMIAELDELRKQGVLTEAEFQQKKEQLLSKM
ncbi:MAG: PH domain-containing protein [Chloroflexi bacterium]|nr:PH domain-containing protein [Chloroflexota bacterium]